MVVKASMKGHPVTTSDAFYWVENYNDQKTLAELGFNFSGENLDCFEVAVFTKIASLYDKEFLKELPKGKGKR